MSDRTTNQHTLLLHTRPVKLKGEDHITVVTKEALDDLADQILTRQIPVTTEHLGFIPQIGVMEDPRVVEASDGAFELWAITRPLPKRTAGEPDLQALAELPTGDCPSLTLGMSFSRRNFSDSDGLAIKDEADIPIESDEKWSAVPPNEFILTVAASWVAMKFAGAFVAELGKQAGGALGAQIASWSKRSKVPERDILFTLEFEVTSQEKIVGYVIAKPDQIEQQVSRALDASEPLASLAAVANKQDLFPDFKTVVYVFDGRSWRLAWWTDGESVAITNWYKQNPPDTTGLLGH